MSNSPLAYTIPHGAKLLLYRETEDHSGYNGSMTEAIT